MQVIKPVDTCEVCQTQFQQLRSLYAMYQACPADPGAIGIFQAALEDYNQHHRRVHPVHPDMASKR